MSIRLNNLKIRHIALLAACWLLSPSLGFSQAIQQQPCLKLKKTSYSHNALRQGGAYDITLQFETEGCVFRATTAYMLAGYSAWQSVPDAGLRADEPSFVNPVIIDDQRSRMSVTIKVSASNDAEVGMHAVQIGMNYDVTNALGTAAERASFTIPVRVVAAGTHVKVEAASDGMHLKWYQVALVIVLFPIAFLIYLANEC